MLQNLTLPAFHRYIKVWMHIAHGIFVCITNKIITYKCKQQPAFFCLSSCASRQLTPRSVFRWTLMTIPLFAPRSNPLCKEQQQNVSFVSVCIKEDKGKRRPPPLLLLRYAVSLFCIAFISPFPLPGEREPLLTPLSKINERMGGKCHEDVFATLHAPISREKSTVFLPDELQKERFFDIALLIRRGTYFCEATHECMIQYRRLYQHRKHSQFHAKSVKTSKSRATSLEMQWSIGPWPVSVIFFTRKERDHYHHWK